MRYGFFAEVLINHSSELKFDSLRLYDYPAVIKVMSPGFNFYTGTENSSDFPCQTETKVVKN
jgi:hypothetical protein